MIRILRLLWQCFDCFYMEHFSLVKFTVIPMTSFIYVEKGIRQVDGWIFCWNDIIRGHDGTKFSRRTSKTKRKDHDGGRQSTLASQKERRFGNGAQRTRTGKQTQEQQKETYWIKSGTQVFTILFPVWRLKNTHCSFVLFWDAIVIAHGQPFSLGNDRKS